VKDYAILMLSPQGFVSTWNEGTEKIKGYSAEEIVGYHFSKFYTPEDIAQGVPARELQIATDTGRFEDEGWRMRKDGSRFWANVVLTALFDAKGQLRGFAKVTRDITERKRAEEALRNQANLLDLSHDGIMVRELDGTIRFWNYGAEEMYGFSKHQAEGRVSHEILRTVFPKPLAEIEADLSRNGRWEGELEHTTQDGTHIVVDSRWVLQKVNNGAANRVLEVNNDITERKRVEGESQQKTQALMRSNQELDAFAYAASHDLKAPLRVIHNASKWIEEDLAGHLTAEAQENMDLLRSRVRRMDRLLDDLLEYSRIGRVTEDRDAELVSGTDLMENILGLLAPPEEFVVDTSSTLVGIEVARMPVQQILINLISNAIKHHDKKAGRIGISVEDLGEMLLFSVKDDGPGIPAQYHEKIFKMFQTLKPRDQVEGSGMGLAMVRKHVEVAGGEIKLESAVGQGSTFSFTWPKDRGSTNQTEYKVARIGETS
jgi:PAS domain S-box-containing protein